jgi:hypothetical protein
MGYARVRQDLQLHYTVESNHALYKNYSGKSDPQYSINYPPQYYTSADNAAPLQNTEVTLWCSNNLMTYHCVMQWRVMKNC